MCPKSMYNLSPNKTIPEFGFRYQEIRPKHVWAIIINKNIVPTVLDLPVCFIWDLQVFKISSWELASLSTGKSGGRVLSTFPPLDRLVIFRHFLQSDERFIPTLIYGCENWSIREEDKSRITSAEMEFMGRTAKYMRQDYKTDEEILSELKINSLVKKIQNYI